MPSYYFPLAPILITFPCVEGDVEGLKKDGNGQLLKKAVYNFSESEDQLILFKVIFFGHESPINLSHINHCK